MMGVACTIEGRKGKNIQNFHLYNWKEDSFEELDVDGLIILK